MFANSSRRHRTWYCNLPPSLLSALVHSRLKSCEYMIATRKLNVASVSEIITNSADSSSPSISRCSSSYEVISRTSSMAKGAKRVEQLIKIDLAVLPAASLYALYCLRANAPSLCCSLTGEFLLQQRYSS